MGLTYNQRSMQCVVGYTDLHQRDCFVLCIQSEELGLRTSVCIYVGMTPSIDLTQ